eukprot:TRINITY_DN7696_c0_g1_i1.p1 TRINITY_DN7696_c0_g1~~TRINITY_DN7696_c0_g1_i1.p1  ORF type:complete len:487 (+),score=120.07 TRINITY_DN7696_c0_g1_i1:184-1461(+)
MLLRQSFFERLLRNEMPLESLPAADLIAAQADIRHLSLQQLLHLRCENWEQKPAAAAAQFMACVSDYIERRVLSRLLPAEGSLRLGPREQGCLMQLVLQIYGVRREGDFFASSRWLVRTEGLQAVLDVESCHLQPLEGPQAPTYCHRNLSRVSAGLSKRRQLHWQVELVTDPVSFTLASPRKQRPAAVVRPLPQLPYPEVEKEPATSSAEATPEKLHAPQVDSQPAAVHVQCEQQEEEENVTDTEDEAPEERACSSEATPGCQQRPVFFPASSPRCTESSIQGSATASTCSSPREEYRELLAKLAASEAARRLLEEEVKGLRASEKASPEKTAGGPEVFVLSPRGSSCSEDLDECDSCSSAPADAAWSLEQTTMGTSFLMNCSKDSKQLARGTEQKTKSSKWFRLPKSLKKGGVKLMRGSQKERC